MRQSRRRRHEGDSDDPTPSDDAIEKVEKAVVAPHRAHFQQRGRSGQFVAFNSRREVARGAGGRFVRRLTTAESAEASRMAETERKRFARTMGYHLGDLRAGRLSASEASRRGQESIAEYYERLFRSGMQAAGNPAILLTPRDKAALGRIVRDESGYWDKFMADVKMGRGRLDYDERLGYYVHAAQEAFWSGWALGDFRSSRKIRWIMGDTTHCQSCQGMADKGWMSVTDFLRDGLSHGIMPQSGELECKGVKCQCRLEDNSTSLVPS